MDKRRKLSFVGGELQAWLAYGVGLKISSAVGDEGAKVGLALGRNPTSNVEDEWDSWRDCVGLRCANPTHLLSSCVSGRRAD